MRQRRRWWRPVGTRWGPCELHASHVTLTHPHAEALVVHWADARPSQKPIVDEDGSGTIGDVDGQRPLRWAQRHHGWVRRVPTQGGGRGANGEHALTKWTLDSARRGRPRVNTDGDGHEDSIREEDGRRHTEEAEEWVADIGKAYRRC
jgi:hypothetical protein